METSCLTCGKIFVDVPSAKRKYCSRECAYKNRARVLPSIQANTKLRPDKTCPTCGKTFQVRTRGGGRGTFCSRKCVRFKLNRPRPTNPQAESALVRVACENCGKEFDTYINSPAINCSKKCADNNPLRKARTVATRHQKGSYGANVIYSNSKRGVRRGTYFRSRMEANYAAYLDHLGIKWEYEPTVFKFPVRRGTVTYTPDFYLPEENKYVETKGWMDKKSRIKISRMRVHHPKVRLEVVDWKQYQAIGKEYASHISDWEYAPDGKSF